MIYFDNFRILKRIIFNICICLVFGKGLVAIYKILYTSFQFLHTFPYMQTLYDSLYKNPYRKR